MTAPIPKNESARLAALQRYRILDTDAEEGFDDITTIASFICETPVSFVSFIDRDRQWMKSRRGSDIAETPRDVAFCSHTIMGPEILLVPDARKDDRFAASPLVTQDPQFRFYAGVPIESSAGHRLGALCVLDHNPRSLSAKQKEALRALSRQVLAQLELRRVTDDLAGTLENVHTLSGLLPICAYCKKVRDDQGYWKAVESYISAHSAAAFTHAMCPCCMATHFPETAEER